MPLRRESWFLTHVISGLLFSLVPDLLLALCLLPRLGIYWRTAFLWVAALNVQYLFFFGIAALSALCTGNRFAMVLVYGLINFLSMLLLGVLTALYQPLLPGIVFPYARFVFFSPLTHLLSSELDYLSVRFVSDVYYVPEHSGWPYLVGMLAVGILSLIGALLLYRHRKLECAGDFVAFRPLGLIFQILYTLTAAIAAYYAAALFGQEEYLFLSSVPPLAGLPVPCCYGVPPGSSARGH